MYSHYCTLWQLCCNAGKQCTVTLLRAKAASNWHLRSSQPTVTTLARSSRVSQILGIMLSELSSLTPCGMMRHPSALPLRRSLGLLARPLAPAVRCMCLARPTVRVHAMLLSAILTRPPQAGRLAPQPCSLLPVAAMPLFRRRSACTSHIPSFTNHRFRRHERGPGGRSPCRGVSPAQSTRPCTAITHQVETYVAPKELHGFELVRQQYVAEYNSLVLQYRCARTLCIGIVHRHIHHRSTGTKRRAPMS